MSYDINKPLLPLELNKDEIINVNELNVDDIIELSLDEIDKFPKWKNGRSFSSMCPICLDTETTKWQVGTIKKGKKEEPIYKSFIYIVQLQIGHYTIFIRNYKTALKFIRSIMVSVPYIIRIAVANLSYEWSFMVRDLATGWEEAIGVNQMIEGNHHIICAQIGNAKFVDICRMTNGSLETIGKSYCMHKKMKGDLDYDIPRNSLTPLTDEEIGYCQNDVIVGAEYMWYMYREYPNKNKKLPITATGIPRNEMIEMALDMSDKFKNPKPEYKETIEAVRKSFPQKYSEYIEMMNYLFRGGFTHGNAYYCGDLLRNVTGIDFTSSYPAVMMHTKFVTTLSKKIEFNGKTIKAIDYENEKGLEKLIKNRKDIGFTAKITFKMLKSRHGHSLESKNKFLIASGIFEDNGRIMESDTIKVWLTDADYECYKYIYKWDSIIVEDLKIGIKEPLPDYVLKPLENAYKTKTQMKKNKKHHPELYDEGAYQASKGFVNSCYGVTVQRLEIGDTYYIEFLENGIQYKKFEFDVNYLIKPTEPTREYYKRTIKSKKSGEEYKEGEEKPNSVKKYKAYLKELNAYNKNIDNLYSNFKDHMSREEFNEMIDSIIINECKDIPEIIKEFCLQHEYRKSIREKVLSPLWGIWITAEARRNLCENIYKVEQKAMQLNEEKAVVYYDTDSLYIRNYELYKDIIDDWNNKLIKENAETLCEEMDDLGCFDVDPIAIAFKQLGAKRYLKTGFFEDDKKLHTKITVAGLPKKDFEKLVKENVQESFDIVSDIYEDSFDYDKIEKEINDIYSVFCDGMTLDAFTSSKLMPVYCDTEYNAIITDNYGNSEMMFQSSGQALVSVGFEMRLSAAFNETIDIIRRRA